MASPYLQDISFLIIDDNAFMRNIVKRILASLGAKKIEESEDGADALKILRTFSPDIIITDWVMDPIDGIELTRMIRTASDSKNRFVPIIMLTAHSELARIIEARDCGINEIVIKPVSVKTLFSRIQSVIERPRPYVEVGDYFGPDRRRKQVALRDGEKRGSTLPEELGADSSLSQDDVNELMAAEGKARGTE